MIVNTESDEAAISISGRWSSERIAHALSLPQPRVRALTVASALTKTGSQRLSKGV
jgi:hypothetical protein